MCSTSQMLCDTLHVCHNPCQAVLIDWSDQGLGVGAAVELFDSSSSMMVRIVLLSVALDAPRQDDGLFFYHPLR
jgi:hypothetical protein